MTHSIKKALITGGNGNLGRLVADQLKARNIEVIKFDIPGTEPPGMDPQSSGSGVTHNAETIVIGDIRDQNLLRDIMKTHQPDTVYHLASLLSGSSEADPEAAWEINATASFNLMRLALEFNVGTFFFASTIATFGEDLADPMPETQQQWPANIYGVTKVAVERLGVYFKQKNNMDFRCLRFPLVFSPFAPPSAVTAYPSHAFRAACNNEPFTFPVSPGAGMSSMLLEDVINGIVKFTMADRADLSQHVYSVHGYHVTAEEVAQEIQSRIPGFTYDFVPNPTVDALLAAWPNIIVDDTARQDWGWEPEFDFKKSADQMMSFFGGK